MSMQTRYPFTTSSCSGCHVHPHPHPCKLGVHSLILSDLCITPTAVAVAAAAVVSVEGSNAIIMHADHVH